MSQYIVHFELDEAPPVRERIFKTKAEAFNYKSEHPDGKFATVVPLKGTFGEAY